MREPFYFSKDVENMNERIITPQDEQYRAIIGTLKVLSVGDDYITDVSLDLLDSRVNRNNWQYENLEQHLSQFYRKPLLVAYEGEGLDGKPKFGGHNFRYAIDPETGEEYCSFVSSDAEKIIGVTAFDEGDVRTERRGNDTWITATGVIYEWYAHELVSKLKAQQGRGMDVSIETLILDGYEDETGVEHFTKYIVLGVTLLGDGIMPAVEGAHIKTLSEIEAEMPNLKLRAASYRNQENKPQEKQNEKRSEQKPMELFTKRQVAELSAKFEDYTVLAAGRDENGIHVALMAADGTPYCYTSDTMETFAPEKILQERVNAVFKFGDDVLEVDACVMNDAIQAKYITAHNELESVKGELASALQTITSMKEAENNRRVNAAKEIAKKTLEAFNENRENKIDISELDALNADIDNGVYTNSVNNDGEWTGDKAVEDRVYAICGRKVAETEKADVKHYLSWGGAAKKQENEPQTFGELFGRMNRE